jgi:trigger factor
MGVQVPPLAPRPGCRHEAARTHRDRRDQQVMTEEAGFLKEIKSPSALKRVLEFEVPRETVEKEISEMIENIRKEVKVNGFRKGKVPKDLAKARYARTAEREAIEKVIQQAYTTILDKQALKPVTPASVTDLSYDEGAPLTFTVEIEILPDVNIENYKGVRVEKVTREVEDKEVDAEIENLRDRFSTSRSVDRAAVVGDIVAIDYWRIDEEGTEISDSKITGFPFELGKQKVLKEFDEGLLGVKKGDRKEITVTYPDDFDQADLRGKTVKFGVEVGDVKTKILPELTDAFAIEVGADSLLDLRLKVRKSIQKMYDDDAKSRMKGQIMQAIIEASQFDVPEAMIEASLDAIMETYTKGQDKDDEAQAKQLAELRQKMRPVAVNVVKEQFVIDEVAKREGVQVEQADIESVISSFAERMNVPPEQVRDWALKSGEMRRWRHNILADKVTDLLLENAEMKT